MGCGPKTQKDQRIHKSHNLKFRTVRKLQPPHWGSQQTHSRGRSVATILDATVCCSYCCCLPGHSTTGITLGWHGNSNIERLPPGPTTSKGRMNVYCLMWEIVSRFAFKELPSSDENWQHGWPTSSSCDDSPCCLKGTVSRDFLICFMALKTKSVLFVQALMLETFF
jgi:hypothetical protein